MAGTTGILPDRYDAPRLVGSGGMGEIYVAHDRKLDRIVAVKLLAERLSEDPDLRVRFRREALTAARLSGEPHVVTIFDVGEHGGRPFTVMEHLSGGTLAVRAGGGRVDPEQALAWLAQAAEALDAAHGHGIVHRDVKPANLLFDSSDRLQVVDFGIARVVDETAGMTAPGTVLGTAGYLAPEQAQGHETTAASDRYALAVVAYELLTGRRPFERESPTAEAAAHIHEIVPPASEQADLPEAVDAVFARALAKKPVHRFPTAAAFVDALSEALLGTNPPPPVAPPPARRPSAAPVAALVAGAMLLTIVGIGAALLVFRDDPPSAAPPETTAPTQPTTTAPPPTTTVGQTTAPTQPSPAPANAVGVEQAADLNDEAFALMQDGRWEEALPLLERAVPALRDTYSDDFPYEAYAEYNLGRTLVELDRCDEAVPHLERSRELQGNHPDIRDALRACGAQGGKNGKSKDDEDD
ncbi:MAG: serine/threonine-protein kinase [Gaiellaceae bacterium]